MSEIRNAMAQAVLLGSPCEATKSNQPPLWLANFGEHGNTLSQFLLPEDESVDLVNAFKALKLAIYRIEIRARTL